MKHTLQCGDVIPGCAEVFRDDSEDALLGQVAAHAQADHGISDIDEATLAKVKGAITTE
jgi:predicted small metal-binding protein